MSKRTGSHNDGDEPTPKHFRIGEGNHTISLGLHNPEAWDILRKFLTSDMSMGEMDAALESHLSSRFSAEDWVDPRCLLFSGDGDDVQSLTNLLELKIKYVPEPKSAWAIPIQQLHKPRKLHKQKNPYILDEADEDNDDDDDNNDDKEEEEATEAMEGGGSSGGIRLPHHMVTSFPLKTECTCFAFKLGPSFDDGRTATEYIAAHLRKQKFLVTMSAWILGQLYVVADSPKTISQSLTSSLYLAMKYYLPDTSWVRITKGKYKDDVGRVFKSKEDFVEVLIAAWDFPYKMPQGTRALVHLESGWDTPFLKDTMVAFSMQFLHVAGSYTGLEGYLIQMCGDLFHVCQEISKEVQHVEPPCDPDSIEIGDYIQVLDGEHAGKHGIINWFPKGDTNLWFQDIFTVNDMESSLDGLLSISVPAKMVQRTDLAQTIHFTNERGFDVRPRDTVSVACGPEFRAQGLMQHVDFLKARLSILCDGDKSIIHVPIRFVIKTHNAALDSFKKDIGQEVFVIRGEWKGYRGTLDSVHYAQTPQCCHKVRGMYFPVIQRLSIIKIWEDVKWCDARRHGVIHILRHTEKVIPVFHHPIGGPGGPQAPTVLKYNMTLRQAPMPAHHQHSRNGVLTSSTSGMALRQEWRKYETSVSVGFMNGKLQKRFVSMACPDPFCGENGPAPEGCVAVFCTSNSAGTTLEHYHIPASDLSPAPPCKKNQECLILDGVHCRLIRTVTKCEITKKNTVDIKITPTVTVGRWVLVFNFELPATLLCNTPDGRMFTQQQVTGNEWILLLSISRWSTVLGFFSWQNAVEQEWTVLLSIAVSNAATAPQTAQCAPNTASTIGDKSFHGWYATPSTPITQHVSLQLLQHAPIRLTLLNLANSHIP
ncbi:hypothetical protein BD769DRAFT_1385495 [Suillus cothurnatus]|nr:hypothetical protein BD769DRAFT_1385495 [Suillus cothurnatus]